MNDSGCPGPANGTVSAVVVTYDRPALLERTIDSILRQTHPVDEIIVSDDGHREATAHLLRSRFPNARHVPGPSRGVAANRNYGVRQAHGAWILLLDDDCELDPVFVERALGQAAREGSHHVYFAAVREHDRVVLPNAIGYLGYLTRTAPTFRYPAAISSQAIFFSTALSRLVAFDECMVFGYEEIDFACRATWAGYPGQLVPGCVNRHLDPGHPTKPYQNPVMFDSNRVYMRFKHLLWHHRDPIGAAIFVWIAFWHLCATQTRHNAPVHGIAHTWGVSVRFVQLVNRRARQCRMHPGVNV